MLQKMTTLKLLPKKNNVNQEISSNNAVWFHDPQDVTFKYIWKLFCHTYTVFVHLSVLKS